MENAIRTPPSVRVIAVTGGKGGVGKSTVAINLAIALAGRQRDVMILDADLGLANVDVLLGLHSNRNLSHVMAGTCGLDDIVMHGPAGIKVVPAASGVKQLANISDAQAVGLVNAFSEMSTKVDDLIVDTAAGVSDSVVRFAAAAQEVVVVVCDEPASITDAYALIKLLSRDHGINRFQVIANKARGAADGRALFDKISAVSTRFLDVSIAYLGHIPRDANVRKAIQKQCSVVDGYPTSRAATAFAECASRIQRWPAHAKSRGNIEFFAERLVAPLATEVCANGR